jgi:hypothetical protein
MPSVEYPASTLIYDEQTETVEDPETGEQIVVTQKVDKRPFELRISKWLERGGVYQLHGFVEVTDFGITLASQTDSYAWLIDTYQTVSEVDMSMVSEWVQGVDAVENADLGSILAFGNVSPVKATVTADRPMRMDFEIHLDGPTTFNIDWLTVDFDPSRSGS